MLKSTVANQSPTPEWDLQKIKIDGNGVHDFFWPMAYGEVMEFNRKSLSLYSSLIQTQETRQPPDTLVPYQLFGKYYLCEITAIYRALLLKKKCDKTNKTPYLPDNWSLTPLIWQGKPPIENAILTSFKNRPVPRKKAIFSKSLFKRGITFLKKFHPSKNGMVLDGLKLSPITNVKLQNSIIVTQRTALILKHAKTEAKEKIFCRSNRWLSSITDEEIKEAIKHKNQKYEDDILNIFKNLCHDKNLEISNEILAYIKNFIEQGIACLHIHNARLKNTKLPKHIWTGSAGNLWDTLLRLNVIQNGGIAEAHDHGTASGLTGTYSIPFIELWGCNKFYTYTDEHAALLRKLSKECATLSTTIPEISGLHQHVKITPKNTEQRKIKTIMIVSTIYDRDRGRLIEIGSELARVDFQAQLIFRLKSQGYHVIFKAHPESPSKPPAAFTKLGAEIEERPFNKVTDGIDLFLFDYACTSTVKEALETDIPFVIIDLEKVDWEKTMLPLFKNRAEIVHSQQDEHNRFTIKLDDLDKAIKNAALKGNDKVFYETYFGFPHAPAITK